MPRIDVIAQQQSDENKADVIIVNGEAFTFKATGLTRRVFENADKTKVVKVPVEKYSQHFNDDERDIWDNASEEKRKELATTEMLPNGYIMQEYLHSLDDPNTADWLGRIMTMKEIRFADSCRSDVGFDKDGNLKCFDLEEYKKY